MSERKLFKQDGYSTQSHDIHPSTNYSPPIPGESQPILVWKVASVTLTCSKCQVPRLACTPVQRTRVELARREEVERRPRIDEGKIGIEDTLPSSSDFTRRRHSILRKVHIPLFLDELLRPSQCREGLERKHVDASTVSNWLTPGIEPCGTYPWTYSGLLPK